MNRLLSQLALERQLQGAYEAQNQSVLDVHEDSSIAETQQLSARVEFAKKSIKRFINSSTIIGLLLLATSIIALFIVKDRVQNLTQQLNIVQRGIIHERENIHILHAEWAYLTKPQVIQKLTDKYMNLQTVDSRQIVVFDLSSPMPATKNKEGSTHADD